MQCEIYKLEIMLMFNDFGCPTFGFSICSFLSEDLREAALFYTAYDLRSVMMALQCVEILFFKVETSSSMLHSVLSFISLSFLFFFLNVRCLLFTNQRFVFTMKY